MLAALITASLICAALVITPDAAIRPPVIELAARSDVWIAPAAILSDVMTLAAKASVLTAPA